MTGKRRDQQRDWTPKHIANKPRMMLTGWMNAAESTAQPLTYLDTLNAEQRAAVEFGSCGQRSAISSANSRWSPL